MKTTTPDRRGAGATEGRDDLITQHTRYNTTLANYSHPYGVYVSTVVFTGRYVSRVRHELLVNDEYETRTHTKSCEQSCEH